MLPSFYIENFRLFDALSIKRLDRVNLIVGRNNAGKSAFLEAVFLYGSNASPEAIYELINYRQEHYDSDTEILSSHPIKHFFKGHKLPDLKEPGFKLVLSQLNFDGCNKDLRGFKNLVGLVIDSKLYSTN